MVSLRWSSESLSDLNEIADYLKLESPTLAEMIVRKLLERGEKVIEFPMAGRVVPEHNKENIRELIEYPYRIIYEIYDTNIAILRIIHGARHFNPE